MSLNTFLLLVPRVFNLYGKVTFDGTQHGEFFRGHLQILGNITAM